MVYCNAIAVGIAQASKKRGIDQLGACRVDLGHEGVDKAALDPLWLEGPVRVLSTSGELRVLVSPGVEKGIPCHIGISLLVYCDAIAVGVAQASKERGVDQLGARRVDLCHEGVDRAALNPNWPEGGL